MTEKPEHAVEITRTFQAPAEDLYAAWTDPAIMRRWMADQVEADVRVGGSYRNQLDVGDGGTYEHRGEYLVLEPGRRVVQTFAAGPAGDDAPAPNPHSDEFIGVGLRPLGPARTELTFTNGWNGAGLDDEGMADTAAAWSGWLDRLEEALRTL